MIVLLSVFFTGCCFASVFTVPYSWESTGEGGGGVRWIMQDRQEPSEPQSLQVFSHRGYDLLTTTVRAGWRVTCRIDRGGLCPGHDIFKVKVTGHDVEASEGVVGVELTKKLEGSLKFKHLVGQGSNQKCFSLGRMDDPAVVYYCVEDSCLEAWRFLGVDRRCRHNQLFAYVSISYSDLPCVQVGYGMKSGDHSEQIVSCRWDFLEASREFLRNTCDTGGARV